MANMVTAVIVPNEAIFAAQFAVCGVMWCGMVCCGMAWQDDFSPKNNHAQTIFHQLHQPFWLMPACTFSSKKCEKEEKQEKDKCKTAMEKGNIDGARIYAQNAIRKHNEALNYLRLQSRIDAVASRLDTAIKVW